jgi:hypothetical protein
MTAPNKGELVKYGIDLVDFGKGSARVDYVLQHELAGDTFAAARTNLSEAWKAHLNAARKVLDEKMDAVLRQIPALEGQKKAEAVLELCRVGEKYVRRAPQIFWIADAEAAATVICQIAASPSVALRVLNLTAVGSFAADSSFLRALYRNGGHQLLALSLDRHNAVESDAAMNAVQRILEARLASPGPATPAFPLCLSYRIATMIDPGDELPAHTPQRRLRAIQLALLVLRASPQQAAAADIVRLLLSAATSRSVTVSESELVVSGILAAFDEPKRRQYIKDTDLSPLFIPFTTDSANSKAVSPESIASMNVAKDIMCRILATWTGLLWVASEGQGLRALMDLLLLPGPADRKMVLLTLFNKLLRRLAPHRGIAPLPNWLGEDFDKRLRTPTVGPTDFDMVNVDDEFSGGSAADSFSDLLRDDVEDDAPPTTKSVGYHPLDPLLGAALLVLDHHGLPHALISIVKRSADENASVLLAQEAAVLFQHILVLMDTALPRQAASGLHSALSSAVAELSNRGNVLVGSLTGKLLLNHQAGCGGVAHISAPLLLNFADTTQQLDEQLFQAMLKDTHVEQGEHSRWNLDALAMLVYGPLRQPQRLRWVRDNTRFFTRILGFFRPSATGRCFGTLKREESSAQLCGFGLAVIDLLLCSRDGVDILEKSEFVKGIKAMLQEVLEKKPQILSRERLANTASGDYLRFVGHFTACAHGLGMLSRHLVLDAIQSLYNDLQQSSSSQDEVLRDVCHRLLPQMCLSAVPNYGVCEQIRLCVRLALQWHTCNPVRLCAAMQLKKVMWRDLSSSMTWGVDRLLDGLRDSTLSVVECSLKLLTSICASSDAALAHLIASNPMPIINNPVIVENRAKLNLNALLYRVLSDPKGYEFLQMHGWVEKELAQWMTKECESYVGEMESIVQPLQPEEPRRKASRSFSDPAAMMRPSRGRGQSMASSPGGTAQQAPQVPWHFAGALCASEGGCRHFLASAMWTQAQKIILESTKGAVATDVSVVSEPPSKLQLEEDGIQQTMYLTPETSVALEQMAADGFGFEEEDAFDRDVEMEDPDGSVRSPILNTSSSPADFLWADSSRLAASEVAYASRFTDISVPCSGNMQALKAAIYTLSHMGSTQVGLDALRLRGEAALQRILDLASYASCLSVRGAALNGLSIISRCPQASSVLDQGKYLIATGSYVSAAGIPFSVSFVKPASCAWMHVPKRRKVRYASAVAYGEGTEGAIEVPREVPTDLAEALLSLVNPISRDSAKARLHQQLKEHPEVLASASVRELVLRVAGMYRMRHQERYFAAELLTRSLVSSSATEKSE